MISVIGQTWVWHNWSEQRKKGSHIAYWFIRPATPDSRIPYTNMADCTWNCSREEARRSELVRLRHWLIRLGPWIPWDSRYGWFCQRVMSQPGWRRVVCVQAAATATSTFAPSSATNREMVDRRLYQLWTARRACAVRLPYVTWLTSRWHFVVRNESINPLS